MGLFGRKVLEDMNGEREARLSFCRFFVGVAEETRDAFFG